MLQPKTTMSLLNLRLAGQLRSEPNIKLYLPPSYKPEGKLEQVSSEHFRQEKSIEPFQNIREVYYLERRMFL
jgi:hypothetical protein